jgi:hypothetical protein
VYVRTATVIYFQEKEKKVGNMERNLITIRLSDDEARETRLYRKDAGAWNR